MLDPPANQAASLAERLRARVAPRVVGLVLALVAEAIVLLLLLSLNDTSGADKEHVTVVDLAAHPASEDPPKPEPSSQPKAAAEPRPNLRPPPPQAVPVPVIEPVPTPVPLVAVSKIPVAPTAPPAARPAQAPPVSGPAYGPPDSGGGGGAYGDTARVGTAPNGQPMYAAAWYRKPADGELQGYLSTASGPGWGLIACKTVPDFRVEDCVGLDEYPEGSQILRAVLAAAWQFRVRPPRKGGELLVGSWVRIRIDYEVRRE
ncbi:MAG: hypothetical protein ABIT09_03985 [Croceibacterium sp.]